MSKRVIHELSVEDLVALAAGAKPKDIVEKVSEAGKFIYDLKIKHGDAKIPANLIFYTYKQWKGWGNKCQSRPQFFKDFKTYFAQHRTTDGITYLLNPKPFDLSDDTYWLMRADLRNEKAKKSQR